MGTKLCSTCKTNKDRADFSKRAKSPDGLSYSCKDCQKEQARTSYQRRKFRGLGKAGN